MNQGASLPDVVPEKFLAEAGKGLTTQDPRFKPNKLRRKRMNLRIRRPS
jgi:hypothetical protein